MKKTEFTRKYKTLLSKTRIGKSLSGEDYDFIIDNCKKSLLYRTKASREGVEVFAFNRVFAGRSNKFFVLKESGKEIIISRSKLVGSIYGSKKIPHRNRVLTSMRSYVEDQLIDFRTQHKKLVNQALKDNDLLRARDLSRCRLTGKLLNTCKTAVDHLVPFSKLVDDFLELEGLRMEDISLKGRANVKYFEDEELAHRWCDFHKNKAELQMVCSSANSKAGSKGYSSKN